MRNLAPCIIIIALLASVSCGKKDEKRKDPAKTPAVAAAKVTVASLAELLTQGKTPEFVSQLAQLTALQVNDPVDGSGRTLAMIAAGKGDVPALKAIVEKAARLDVQDRQGRTALHHGAGSVPVVTFLLERKVSPDPVDAEGRTPLHAAIVSGRCEVVGLLLAAGANRDARDRAGLTPLHLAAALPDTACLATLLERKAGVNHADAAGLTPALAAASAGNLPALERLLTAGASLTKKTKRGDTAVHLAAGAKTLDVLKFLVEKKRQFQDVRNGQGQTPLHAAAMAGATEAAAWLLSKKANVGAKDKEGRTPLHAGAARGHLAMVKLLLEKKAQLDSPDFKKRTPLHVAIMAGKTEVANHLVAAGASLTLTDLEGFAALHHAIIAGDETLAGGIIEKSGKVDVPTKDGWTALHLAAHRGQEKMVRLLLGKGANIKARDRKGNHPWHLALDDTPPMFAGELAELKTELEERSSSGTPSTSGTPVAAKSGADAETLKAAIAWLEEEQKSASARRAGRQACARLLLEQGGDLEARDHSGRDGLQIAAASGMKDLFDLLRGKGLKGDKPDYRQRTLLYHAAIGGDLAIVKAAMEMGFTEVAFKYKRETPLHVAAQHNRAEVVEFLLGKGADVKAKATNGDSVVLYAARNLAVDAATALFAAGAPAVVSAEEPEESTGPGEGSDDEGDWRPPSGPGGDDSDYEEMPPEEGDGPGGSPDEAPGSATRFETVKMDGTALDVVFSAAVKNTEGKKGRTPRAFVLLRRQLRFLELLFDKGTPVRAEVKDEPIPLAAVLAGHRELVELLMEKDAKFKEDLGEIMLGAAIREHHYALAKHLLDQGILPQKGPENRALVQEILTDEALSDRAAALDVFGRLLPTVQDLDAQDEQGYTLLHFAVGTGTMDFVQAMLVLKPSLSKVDQTRETPVHVAVRNGMLKTVELLLTADPKAPEGERPFVPLAAGSGSVEVLQWLLRHGYKDVETGGGKVGGLFTAAKAGAWSAFQVLAEGRGEAMKAVDDEGATLAHYAAQGGSEKILKALQKAGLGFSVANKAGETPLHHAVKAGKSGAVAWLLKNGADPAAVDGTGKKAVDYADEALKPLFEGK